MKTLEQASHDAIAHLVAGMKTALTEMIYDEMLKQVKPTIEGAAQKLATALQITLTRHSKSPFDLQPRVELRVDGVEKAIERLPQRKDNEATP